MSRSLNHACSQGSAHDNAVLRYIPCNDISIADTILNGQNIGIRSDDDLCVTGDLVSEVRIDKDDDQLHEAVLIINILYFCRGFDF